MGPPSQRGHRRCTVIVCYSGTMATPGELGPFADRRLRFAAALGDALAIIPGAQEARRNGDVNYEFRQSSDFFFLTDRKSTRLNSSHITSSYAVLCLQKEASRRIRRAAAARAR